MASLTVSEVVRAQAPAQRLFCAQRNATYPLRRTTMIRANPATYTDSTLVLLLSIRFGSSIGVYLITNLNLAFKRGSMHSMSDPRLDLLALLKPLLGSIALPNLPCPPPIPVSYQLKSPLQHLLSSDGHSWLALTL